MMAAVMAHWRGWMQAERMKFGGAWFFAIQVLAAAPSTSSWQKKDGKSKANRWVGQKGQSLVY